MGRLVFLRLRRSRAHAASHNGRSYIVWREGPKHYRGLVTRAGSYDRDSITRTFRTLAGTKAWLEGEAERLAARQNGGRRTPIVRAIEEKGDGNA